jgi:hypothetical protein
MFFLRTDQNNLNRDDPVDFSSRSCCRATVALENILKIFAAPAIAIPAHPFSGRRLMSSHANGSSSEGGSGSHTRTILQRIRSVLSNAAR